MKTCFKCGKEKERSDFYPLVGMKDGLLGKCKECTKEDVRKNRQSSPNARLYDKRRFKESKERREKTYAGVRKRREQRPDQYKARTALGNAVRDGRIVKPIACTVCGDTSRRIEGHHPDYTKPLEVVWCCTPCHRKIDGTTIPARPRHCNR